MSIIRDCLGSRSGERKITYLHPAVLLHFSKISSSSRCQVSFGWIGGLGLFSEAQLAAVAVRLFHRTEMLQAEVLRVGGL